MQKDIPNVPAEVENAITEKKKRGWVSNSQENFGQENVQPGDNAKYLRHALAAYNLPPIDLDNDEQVQGRIEWYFTHCIESDIKPTVMGLANSLGVERRTLSDWRNGRRRGKKDNRTEIIRQAYGILEELWEDYMLNGKINPVSGIFLGRNHWGYQDKIDLVVTPNNGQLDPTDITVIEQKYAELPDDIGE